MKSAAYGYVPSTMLEWRSNRLFGARMKILPAPSSEPARDKRFASLLREACSSAPLSSIVSVLPRFLLSNLAAFGAGCTRLDSAPGARSSPPLLAAEQAGQSSQSLAILRRESRSSCGVTTTSACHPRRMSRRVLDATSGVGADAILTTRADPILTREGRPA